MQLVLSVWLSYCEQDSSRMRLWISTKHGRHGHGVTLQKWLNFGVELDPDVYTGSLSSFLNITIIRCWVARERHCASPRHRSCLGGGLRSLSISSYDVSCLNFVWPSNLDTYESETALLVPPNLFTKFDLSSSVFSISVDRQTDIHIDDRQTDRQSGPTMSTTHSMPWRGPQ